MRLVARLRSGRSVYYAAGVFYLDGNGSISRARMSKLDKHGDVEWLDDDLRVDFRTSTGQLGAKADGHAPVEDGHRFEPLRAAKKLLIATALFAMFWVIVAGVLVFNSARVVAEERAQLAHAAEVEDARTAYTPYYELTMATEGGIARARYTPALERADAALRTFTPVAAQTEQVAAHLAEAQRAYDGADDIWAIAQGADAQRAYDEYKAQRGDLGLTATDPDAGVQELWARGYDHVAAALGALDDFEGVAEDSPEPQKVTIAEISAVLWERISRAEPPKPDREVAKTAAL